MKCPTWPTSGQLLPRLRVDHTPAKPHASQKCETKTIPRELDCVYVYLRNLQAWSCAMRSACCPSLLVWFELAGTLCHSRSHRRTRGCSSLACQAAIGHWLSPQSSWRAWSLSSVATRMVAVHYFLGDPKIKHLSHHCAFSAKNQNQEIKQSDIKWYRNLKQKIHGSG